MNGRPISKTAGKGQVRLTPVARAAYRVGKGRVTCTLYTVTAHRDAAAATKKGYALGMRGFGARCLCRLGRDTARAVETFRLVVRNTVTPCTLRDVLEDLAAQV